MSMDFMDMFKKDYENAEMIVVGIGKEFNNDKRISNDQINKIADVIESRNYFIISSLKENIFKDTKLNKKRICNPMLIDSSQDKEEHEYESKQWDLYNKWLSCTLNKKLLILELGEGFNVPNLFRWPFEKITMINKKARMYRVNNEFPQIPEEISEKAFSIKCDSNDFLTDIMK